MLRKQYDYLLSLYFMAKYNIDIRTNPRLFCALSPRGVPFLAGVCRLNPSTMRIGLYFCFHLKHGISFGFQGDY